MCEKAKLIHIRIRGLDEHDTNQLSLSAGGSVVECLT